MTTAFLGRTRELAEVQRLLRRSRLVTLMGTGGAGKTRLAREVAERVEGQAFVCELASITDATQVPVAVAAALGFPPELRIPLSAAVADRWGSEAVLVVLDNCEHVRAAVGDVISSLLEGAGGLRILATSRERLRAAGEVAWMLPGLDSKEGLELLEERVCAVEPAFAVTAANREDLVEICRRLDGLPLALELVAPKLVLLPAEQVASMLAGGLALDRAMRATLDWSVDLLSPDARGDLAQLGVFPAGFSLDAAARVLDLAPVAALERLAALRDASLLVSDTTSSEASFRLLEPVRQYAAELLAARPDEQDVHRRHARYVVASAEWIGARVLETPEEGAALARFERILPDIRQAVAWALEAEPAWPARIIAQTGWAWEISSRVLEGEALGRLSLPLAEDADRVRLLVRLASLAGRRNPRRPAEEEAVAAARQAGDTRELGLALGFESNSRPPAEASQPLDELAELAATSGDRLLAGWERFFRANMLGRGGDHGGARAAMEEARTILREELGSAWGAMQSTINLIDYCLEQGDYAAARRYLRECLKVAIRNPGWVAAPAMLNQASDLAARSGRPREALQLRAAQLRISRELGITPSPSYADELAPAELPGRAEQEQARSAGAHLTLEEALALAAKVVEAPLSHPDRRLSRRELEVSGLVARGLSNKEVAAQLHLTVRTVEGHVDHALSKLGLHSRVQLATWVVEHGLS